MNTHVQKSGRQKGTEGITMAENILAEITASATMIQRPE